MAPARPFPNPWPVLGALCATVASLFPASQTAAREQCKVEQSLDGSEVLYCKGRDGTWQRSNLPMPQSTRRAAPLADASAEYTGTFQQTLTTFSRKQNTGLLGRLTGPQKQANSRTTNGSIIIRGMLDRTNSNVMILGVSRRAINASGSFVNSSCEFQGKLDDDTPIFFSGTCTPSQFIGTFQADLPDGSQIRGKFQTKARSFVRFDPAVREEAAKEKALADQCNAGNVSACVEKDLAKDKNSRNPRR